MANYWVAVNGKQVGLPFDNLDAAEQLLLNHMGEDETALALIEVYDADLRPMGRRLSIFRLFHVALREVKRTSFQS